MMGGAPCPVEVMRQVRSRMHMSEVAIVCGMTETAPLSTQTAPDDPVDKRVGTVGRVHPHVEIKVVDPETGETVPRGTPGEQCTRGYSVMLGYWNDPLATRAAIDEDGWMHTGDLAVMDADGYLSIVGRIKDMIIRGGENIYPREIEEFLHGLAGVADAHVIGVPSERYGEEVMAWVKPRAGFALTPSELVAACRGRIATFKIPVHWRIVDDFPMTVTGKIQKFRLRELAGAARSAVARDGGGRGGGGGGGVWRGVGIAVRYGQRLEGVGEVKARLRAALDREHAPALGDDAEAVARGRHVGQGAPGMRLRVVELDLLDRARVFLPAGDHDPAILQGGGGGAAAGAFEVREALPAVGLGVVGLGDGHVADARRAAGEDMEAAFETAPPRCSRATPIGGPGLQRRVLKS